MLQLLIPMLLAQESLTKTIYVALDGSMKNDGSENSPYAPDWTSITRAMNRLTGYDITVIIKEGTYFVDTYDITLSQKTCKNPKSIQYRAEEGKRVRLVGGKSITNWTKSPYYKNIWVADGGPEKYQVLYVNDRRAVNARVPNHRYYSRTLKYVRYEDPNDKNYYIRNFYVQQDCIDILKTLTKEELQEARFVDIHYWLYDRDQIVDIDTEKNIVITRVKKEDEKVNIIPIIKDGDYYYLENLFPALNKPGEWCRLSNGTVYYYPLEGEDPNDVEVYYPIGSFGFHVSNRTNISYYNIEIMYTKYAGIYMSYSENVVIQNCTIRHCGAGISLQKIDNVVVEHNFVEDVGEIGIKIYKDDQVLIHNNIIRGCGKYEFHGWVVYLTGSNNNTVITNNDFSDCYRAILDIEERTPYNTTLIRNITVKDNHLHHAGYNLMDDIGGVMFLQVPRGLIIDHNWVHDVYAPNFCGNGIYGGSGSVGVMIKNNIAYDVTESSFKIDRGQDNVLTNNIIGFGLYIMTWSAYKADTHTFDITNNIFVLNRSTLLSGPWLDNGIDLTIDKNIYWNTVDNDLINFRRKTFDQWKGYGFDTNSYIIDPLFVDVEKRNFNFINNTNYKKINFEPFSLTFGVIGDEWRRLAANYVYEEPYDIPMKVQFSGYEDFENGGSSFIWESTTVSQGEGDVSISTDKSVSGTHSLKFSPQLTSTTEAKRSSISIPVNWVEGHAEFSFNMFSTETSWYNINMDLGKKIDLKYGQVLLNNIVVGNYSLSKWIRIAVFVDYGSVKKNNQINFTIDGIDCNNVDIPDSSFKKTSNIVLANVLSQDNTYFDDIRVYIDFQAPKYFEQEMASKNGEGPNELINGNQNDDPTPKPNGLLDGAIAGIVIAVILVVIAIVGIIIFIRHKNSIEDSNPQNMAI